MRASSRRAREVAAVLMRHGLGSLVDIIDLRRALPRAHPSPPETHHAGPVHLRRALEELGPTFMKLGQVLSTRPDLVPPDFEAELSLLQDSAPTVSGAEISSALVAALGRPLNDIFDRFDEIPIAAASIGQVHAATLRNGTDVVVKVRRPGVGERVTVDLELLERLAASAARHSSLARRYDPVGLAHEFGTTLLAELDYPREGRNAELVAHDFAGDERVHVPSVYWEGTRAGVLTEERIRGTKIDDVNALDTAGIDRVALAHAFADVYLTMVFVHRFFHADPHPGNVFVEPDGRIGFVDFGMVGSVTDHTRRGLGAILLALVAREPATMADGLLGLGIACDDIDRSEFEADLGRLLDRYAHLPLEQLHLRLLLTDLMGVVRAHRLRLPSDLALLLKTVMMCEGVAAQLDPAFELTPILVPYAARLVSSPLPPAPSYPLVGEPASSAETD